MLTFGLMLDAAGVARPSVRLLRHQDTRVSGETLYGVWRDDLPRFEAYQSTMSLKQAAKLNAPYWAAFVGTPDGGTLFAGIYGARSLGPSTADRVDAFRETDLPSGSVNLYETGLSPLLANYIGRLWIDWGSGTRAWVQYAERRDKPVTELRRAFSEPEFPGFSAFGASLSEIENLPASWREALASTRGVYLLTGPKTREQYVGQAGGEKGFFQRWREYAASGHGGNVALKSRDPSDYRISILETVGSGATDADLTDLEKRWKNKLQSREMGLNRN